MFKNVDAQQKFTESVIALTRYLLSSDFNILKSLIVYNVFQIDCVINILCHLVLE